MTTLLRTSIGLTLLSLAGTLMAEATADPADTPKTDAATHGPAKSETEASASPDGPATGEAQSTSAPDIGQDTPNETAADGGPETSGEVETLDRPEPHERKEVLASENFEIAGLSVEPASRQVFTLRSSESFLSGDMNTWGEVIHGRESGPVLCLTGGIHGDELNGVEIVRRTLKSVDPEKLRGVLVGVPVVNPFAFVNQTRYLPDRRDLNRYFPGRAGGSMAARIAWDLWSNVIMRCTHLIDLHTGSQNRTNLPQIRGDLTIPAVMEIVRAFDAPVVIHNPGLGGTLRSAAARAGITAVLYEAGETLRFQTEEIERGVLGIRNVMQTLGMRGGRRANLGEQHIYAQTRWLRADRGGILELRTKLGDKVDIGEKIGTISDPLRRTEADFVSLRAGRVIGMSVLPMVVPGMAVVHLGQSGVRLGAAEAEDDLDPDRPE